MILPQTSGSEEDELVHEVEVAAESLFHLKTPGFSVLFWAKGDILTYLLT